MLPLEFMKDESRESLGITGEESFDISGIAEGLEPRKSLSISAGDKRFEVVARLDTPHEVDYYRHGGVLQYVLRSLVNDR